jgi:N-acetylneuraminate synthase
LDPLVPFFKISSSDITNLPFIEHLAKKGKPILLSTGASTLGEVDTAVNTIKAQDNSDICLLHCVLNYPTDYRDTNLNVIKHLGEVFKDCMLGYSDHTCPDENMAVLLTAYLFGAKVIEKHFTLDKSLPGNDHYHAMDPEDLRKFKASVAILNKVGGSKTKRVFPCEESSRKHARRSIVAKRNIKKGEKISQKNVTFKRPGTGISPAQFHTVKGRPAKRDISHDAILTWKDI